jgi:hypothetical protein
LNGFNYVYKKVTGFPESTKKLLDIDDLNSEVEFNGEVKRVLYDKKRGDMEPGHMFSEFVIKGEE